MSEQRDYVPGYYGEEPTDNAKLSPELRIYDFADCPDRCPECDSQSFISAGGMHFVCHICFLLRKNAALERERDEWKAAAETYKESLAMSENLRGKYLKATLAAEASLAQAQKERDEPKLADFADHANTRIYSPESPEEK